MKLPKTARKRGRTAPLTDADKEKILELLKQCGPGEFKYSFEDSERRLEISQEMKQTKDLALIKKILNAGKKINQIRKLIGSFFD